MAVSRRLHAYLALERAMVELDAARDPLADALRDQMDDVWYALSDENRAWLDRRSGEAETFAGTVPVDLPASSEPTGEVVLPPTVLEVLDGTP